MTVVELCKKYFSFTMPFVKMKTFLSTFSHLSKESVYWHTLFMQRSLTKCYFCLKPSSTVVPRVLFDLDIEKNYSAKLCFSNLAP